MNTFSLSALLKYLNPPCRETYRVITVLVLNIDKMYLFLTYQIHYFKSYCLESSPEKKVSACIRKGTWTDGPPPAGPMYMYTCPIKFQHFIPLHQKSNL